MHRRTLIHAALASLGGMLASPQTLAQAWPTAKPITYLVPFPAGGTTDVLARLIGQQLGPILGTTVVADNKGGAGGSSEIAASARRAGRRQGQGRRAVGGLGRQRHLAAPGARAAGLQVGRQVHPHPVQGQWPGDPGRDRRPGRQ